MSKTLRAAIYARYSTDLQNPKSVRDQITLCEREAARKGWHVVQHYHDSGISGSTDNRPGYRDLRAALSKGEYDIILAESLDRLSRDQEHAARLFKDARFNDVDIHTLDRGRVDIIQIGFNATIAAVFLEAQAAKTRRGLLGRVQDGKSAGGLSYGYKVPQDEVGNPRKGELAINEEEALIVRRIFREYTEGKSPLKIATSLNDDGIPAPRNGRGKGGAWKQNTINGNRDRGTGILNNELYIGRRVWNRLSYRKDPATGRRLSRPNPKSEWEISEVPDLRIIDEVLWEAVKSRQDSLQKKRGKREAHDRNGLSASQSLRRRKYLLSGLLRCGSCGGNMTVAGSGSAKRYYCANAKEKGPSICCGMPGLLVSVAEEAVLGQLRDHLLQDSAYRSFVASFEAQLKAQQRDSGEALRVKDKTIGKLERERAALMEAVKRGIAADEILKELEQVANCLLYTSPSPRDRG